MLRTAFVVVALVATSFVAASSANRQNTPVPTPPTVEQNYSLEVGHFAALRNKGTVEVLAFIDASGVRTVVSMSDTMFMRDLGFDADITEPVADAIDAAVAESAKSTSFARTEGKVTVKLEANGNARTVTVQTVSSPKLNAGSVVFDLDNAPVVSKLIRRAGQHAAWLSPRLKYLVPGSPDPAAPATK